MNPNHPTPAVDMREVTFTYSGTAQPALQQLNLSIQQGEWVWIVGPGRSGKSTICGLINGLLTSSEAGTLQGEVSIQGFALAELMREQAGMVGTVFQDPEAGLVLEYVEDELAFGPENLRVPAEDIERRIDQALSQVGMEGTRERRTSELSGGQQQRIAIASVLTMQPELLVLDNALANLDQPAVEQVMKTLQALHRRGHTIIMASSRLDEYSLSIGDRVVILEQGSLLAEGQPDVIISEYKDRLIHLGCWPAGTFAANLATNRLVKEEPLIASNRLRTQATIGPDAGQGLTSSRIRNLPMIVNSGKAPPHTRKPSVPLLQVKDLTFRYDPKSKKDTKDVKLVSPILEQFHMELHHGEILALLGPNGSGKTTFGKLIAGLLTPPANRIFIAGKDLTGLPAGALSQWVGYIFQNPEHQFVADTVLEECIFGLRVKQGLPPWGKVENRLVEPLIRTGQEMLEQFGLIHCSDMHPQQLSIVEKRLLNLASALILTPELIILDEPTAGLDYVSTDRLLAHCHSFAAKGGAVLLITHDRYAVHQWATRVVTLGRP